MLVSPWMIKLLRLLRPAEVDPLFQPFVLGIYDIDRLYLAARRRATVPRRAGHKDRPHETMAGFEPVRY